MMPCLLDYQMKIEDHAWYSDGKLPSLIDKTISEGNPPKN